MSKRLTAFAVSLLLVTAAPARADVLLTPFLGVTFGGDTPNEQVNFGASLALLGGGIFGVELDAAITPNFFDSNDDAVPLDDSNVSTVMGNLMIAASAGSTIRPYGSAGVGLIRARATSVGNVFDVDDNSFGVNVGAGLIGQFNQHVGMRGDVRYFRSVQDSEEGRDIDFDLGGFNFWRASLGVSFRF
jgi:opacity protein-like surface antigen